MKKLRIILSAAASIILVFILLFTALQMVISDDAFINNEYTNLTVASEMGMSNVDLVRSYQRLVNYMEGKVSTIDLEVTINGETAQMFTIDQEKLHMQDVRSLWQNVRQLRDLGILFCLILYLVSVVMGFQDAPETLSKGYMYGFFVCLLFFGFFGTWALLDFSSFWTMFHESLFWNDLWLFDPTESRMINMLPEKIFEDIVKTTAIYMGVAVTALLGAAIFCLVNVKRRRAEILAERERRRLVKERKAAGLPIEDELLSKKQLKAKKLREKEEARRELERKKRLAEKEKAKARAEKEAERKLEQEKLKKALNKKRKKAMDSAAKKVSGLKILSGPKDGAEKASDEDEDWTSDTPAAPVLEKAAPAKKAPNAPKARKNANAKSVKRKRSEPFELVLPGEDDEDEV